MEPCCRIYLSQDEYMTDQQYDVIEERILALLAELRVNAVALVDAFDFCDRFLDSALGRFDGNVYENLYKFALESPLNKTDVSIKCHYPFFKFFDYFVFVVV